jgi:hypothetical protein
MVRTTYPSPTLLIQLKFVQGVSLEYPFSCPLKGAHLGPHITLRDKEMVIIQPPLPLLRKG